ncbi:MAG: endolytic transglycosylase MltG [Candidatus Gracilibacteria bacterium]|nr:endolytic transglycosylase MltG [Candidatus Gracilibacteria bacterium]
MIRIIKLIIWIFVMFGIFLLVNYKSFINYTIPESKTIYVKSGDTLNTTLTRELNLDNFYLKIYLNLNPKQKIKVQVGEYRIGEGENIQTIIETLKYSPKAIDKKITILEGWNIFDIDEYLTKNGLTQAGEFISESKNTSKYKEKFSFLQNALTLEGYLYPDTYFVNPNNFKIENLNNSMLENFRKKVYDNLLSTLNSTQINEIIILASILEKEERNILEKPTVAGILKKRYLNNWMIGADITACYAYSLTSEECKMNLSKYILEKNEYNTRTMVGLPKTPICNPSFESVNAVINSKNTPYWYYLHDKSGQIHYAKTNEEHINNYKYLK